MTLTKAFTAVAVSAVVCAVVGATLGFVIGKFAPDAYRGMFAWGNAPDFSPIEFGVGVGLVQGLVAGLVIGVLLVGIVAWHDVKTRDRQSGNA